MNGQERRKYPRIKLPMPVEYRVVGDSRATPQTGLLFDLSAGGLRLTCGQRVEPGTTLEVHVNLLREEIYILTGTVVWAQPLHSGTECGVGFVGLSPAVKAEINELVQFLIGHQAMPGRPAR